MFNLFEIIGIIGSLFIVFSLLFKTTTFKGTLLLRILNSIGCIFFIVYGSLISAWSTIIANGLCLILNIVYTIIEIRGYLKNETKYNKCIK